MSEISLLAERFLKEAVFQSRARQAAGVALSGVKPSVGSGASNCGLGESTAVDLDLSPEAEEIFAELWPRELAPTEVDHIRLVMSEWIEHQDKLDRKRNHFLRDFRQKHGFDRRAYDKRQSEEFEQGLAKVNFEESQRLRQAAQDLLAPV